MAARGIAYITTMQGWQESDRVHMGVTWQGWQHPDESVGLVFNITPSLLSGVAIKGAIKDAIVDWYDTHPSGNYDGWNNLLDSFAVIGGVI